MLRKAMFTLVVLALSTPLVAAETYKGRITRIDDRTVTLADINGKDVKTFNLAKEVKVFRLNKDVKERESISEGVKADVFKKIADKGLNATVVTNATNEVTEITLTGEKVASAALPALLTVLAQAPPPQARPADQREQLPQIKLDGQWTVAYAEKDGKRAGDKDYGVVTIKNNVVSCQHEGKEKSWRLEFGPLHQVRCIEQGNNKAAASEEQEPNQAGVAHHGVYIASPEYFAVSLNKGLMEGRPGAIPPAPAAVQQRQNQPPQPNQPQQAMTHGPQGAHFVLILKRTGSNNP